MKRAKTLSEDGSTNPEALQPAMETVTAELAGYSLDRIRLAIEGQSLRAGGLNKKDMQAILQANRQPDTGTRDELAVRLSDLFPTAPDPGFPEMPETLIRQYMTTSQSGKVMFSVWDFAGQPIFDPLRHMFLTRMGCYLLVFDMRKLVSRDTAEVEAAIRYLRSWLRAIGLHARGAPVVLVGTHRHEIARASLNLDACHTISRLLKERLVASHDTTVRFIELDSDLCFFPIDNKARTEDDVRQIKQLQEHIESTVTNEAYFQKEIPLSWLRFLDGLEERAKTHAVQFLTLEVVKAIAAKCGIQKYKEALALFHGLGVLIYYGRSDCGALGSFVVLDPQWLIDAIALVICDSKLHRPRQMLFADTAAAAAFQEILCASTDNLST